MPESPHDYTIRIVQTEDSFHSVAQRHVIQRKGHSNILPGIIKICFRQTELPILLLNFALFTVRFPEKIEILSSTCDSLILDLVESQIIIIPIIPDGTSYFDPYTRIAFPCHCLDIVLDYTKY